MKRNQDGLKEKSRRAQSAVASGPTLSTPRMEASMHNGKRALLTVVTAGVLLTAVALAMLSAASSRIPGPSLAQINTFELMVQARDLPDQTIEKLF
jgi:hypothetical protein